VSDEWLALSLAVGAVLSLGVLAGCAREESATGPSPAPGGTPGAASTPTPGASPSATATPQPSPSASATPQPTVTPVPSPSPSPSAAARTVVSSGPFAEAAPGAAFAATNSLFTFQVQSAGRLDARANWPNGAQVRLYFYTGSCSVAQAEANQCGAALATSVASASPATLANVAVNAGFFTIRLENTGPGDTGMGQWEVGLTP
jgi:hypothetical protein